ncbi:MAG TPA: NADH-quinone oxidoreductase subunit C [Acidimicrobiia bacterium]
MTSSPSDTESTETRGPHPLQGYTDAVVEAVGGTGEVVFDTVKVTVDLGSWVEAHRVARDDLDLVFFSFLSAIHWTADVAVGDPLSDGDVEERIELITTVSDLNEGRRVTFSTTLPSLDPSVPSLVAVYAGANWHEREAAEMFGISFVGHPDPGALYLPDAFEGHPLLKSFPLLSREVKPWPGKVDVEAMPESAASQKPSTENPGV